MLLILSNSHVSGQVTVGLYETLQKHVRSLDEIIFIQCRAEQKAGQAFQGGLIDNWVRCIRLIISLYFLNCFVYICLWTCTVNSFVTFIIVQYQCRVWSICFYQSLINLVADYVLHGEITLWDFPHITEWPFTTQWWLTAQTNGRPPCWAQTTMTPLWTSGAVQNKTCMQYIQICFSKSKRQY